MGIIVQQNLFEKTSIQNDQILQYSQKIFIEKFIDEGPLGTDYSPRTLII